MKTGISTASLFLRQETEDAVSTIKELGADCAEVFLQTFYEYRPEFSKALAGNLNGLEINSVHVNTFHIDSALFSRSRRNRGDGFYWLDQVMRSAQLLGCKAYSFHGKAEYGFHSGADKTADIDNVAERLREAVEFCASYGVKLCLENVAWCIYNRPKIFTELKRRIPDLCGVLDIKQARRSGFSYKEYIEDMKGSISHVHLSDVDKDGKMCLPGKGITDFTEVFKRLQGTGFDGNVIIEVYNENYSDISELKQCLDYLNEIIYKLS
ncbi:MAG: sugar phosphate isomerase/epimerase [Clostridia bacterium]|nr:sugar phosphate isomerase/epimerase [Clostridia bacterium]